MSDSTCQTCGTPRTGSEQFCPVCDTFFAWHDPDAQTADQPTAPLATQPPPPPPPPVASSAPPRQAPPPYVAPPTTPPATPPSGARPAAAPGTPPRARPPERVRPPVLQSETTEIEVSPVVPGTFPLVVRNGSTIVDSYDVVVLDPPPWLELEHGDTNLLPDESRPVLITLTVRPGALAVAQRVAVVLQVRSEVDPARAAEVPLTVVVPRSGPPATLTAHPTLVRLHDVDRGTFGLRLDNRGSNHPRTYRLSASDPEGVVSIDFAPPVVEVPAGGVCDVTARFAAPPPPPGAEASRQLSVTATDDAGAVGVQVTLAQSTSAVLEQPPVKLRLEPSQVVAHDATNARLDVVVDNRAGVEAVVVTLRGRDPANVLGFAFDHDGFTLEPGRAVRLGMQLTSGPAPRGQSVTRPFTVVAHAGGSESTIDGTLELSSRQAAIVTAAVRLVPEHLQVSSRKGTFTVEVDNRHGLEPLVVQLSGADEFGRASVVLAQQQLQVPPGQIGRTTAEVNHPKPDGGQSESRRVRVTAASGPDAVHGEATFTQESESHRSWWAYLVAILGVVVVGVGVLIGLHDITLDASRAVVEQIVNDIGDGAVPDEFTIRFAVVIVSLVFVLLAIVMMLFGLVGTTGRGLRVGGVVAVLFGAAAIVAFSIDALAPIEVTRGFVTIIAGAVIAFVGGILVRGVRS